MDNNLQKQAFEEYCSEKTTAHHGGAYERPFWNICASQFMYNPAFDFADLPGCTRYLFTAKHENGEEFTFESDNPRSLLTPIWSKLSQGVITLTVDALNPDGSHRALIGARTFYKCAPFTGNYPPKARTYSEAAKMAYNYAFNQSFIQHWLTDGTPDPEYDLNVYPSKIISSIILAMINYAKLCPEHAEDAIKVAKNSADYLLSISFPEDAPLANLPPTYFLDFRPDPEKHNNEMAAVRIDQIMLFYPASVGIAYLALENATGDKKYFDAALKIAEYYKENVLECGSWHLVKSIKTGELLSENICLPDVIMVFLTKMFERTGMEYWKELADGCVRFMIEKCLKTYNWEGQFEDSTLSVNYSNLSHYGASALLKYFAEHYPDNEEYMAEAEDLLRFVEDQFVIWDKPAPWHSRGYDTSIFYYPAVLEQYNWYIPVDASMADVMLSFLEMFKVRKNPVYLAKACALGDTLTRMQNENTGMIPTQWHTLTCREDGGGFWINCMFAAANALMELAELTEN